MKIRDYRLVLVNKYIGLRDRKFKGQWLIEQSQTEICTEPFVLAPETISQWLKIVENYFY